MSEKIETRISRVIGERNTAGIESSTYHLAQLDRIAEALERIAAAMEAAKKPTSCSVCYGTGYHPIHTKTDSGITISGIPCAQCNGTGVR